MKTIRQEVKHITSSAWNHPIQNPRKALFGFEECGHLSPIRAEDDHNLLEDENVHIKIQEHGNTVIKNVLNVIEKRQAQQEESWKIDPLGLGCSWKDAMSTSLVENDKLTKKNKSKT